MSKGAPNVRYAEIDWETGRTKVHVVLDLEGGTRRDVSTGLSVFDELLADIARYAQVDLGISVECDASTDDYFIVEDVGVALGQAVRIALEDSDEVIGNGSCILPSADSLVLCAIDLNGRRHLGWNINFQRDRVGSLSTENVRQFFETMCDHGRMSLHFHSFASTNDMHLCEAVFRSFGRSLFAALRRDERRTKGK